MEKTQIKMGAVQIALVAVSLVGFCKLLQKWQIKTPKSDQSSSSTLPPSSMSISDTDLGGESEYQVFLSFCGIDTRKTFTDYLYNDLVQAGIRTFRDDNELPVGQQIGPQLIKAIEESNICIPIFSRNYASSRWCLRELAHMVHCHTTKSRKIFPIFYDVEPLHVRHQKGSYEEAFRKHKKSIEEKIVQEWKNALTEVGKLKGLELKKETNGYEGKLVKMVVEVIFLELKKNYMDLPDKLVGMIHHVEKVSKLLDLNSSGVRIVGIHGMGGIGKTTIAKVIYNQLCDRFDRCCFLEDVRETLKQHNGLVNLKDQLISKIGNWKNSDIKDSFRRNKVLIVFDDVDEKSQFDKLVKRQDMFRSGSRIIVTTRNKEVSNYLKESYQENCLYVYKSYEPEFMDRHNSLQLFSNHAFLRDSPPKDYDIVSNEIVRVAAGLPLVLVTIGSLLYAKVDKDLWEETLRKLKKIPHKDVVEKLRISFDALDDEQKQIFLDIACLFVGEDMRYLSYMWEDCGFYPITGINILVHRSLIKVGDDYKIWMHDHIRDLGRQIVREENLSKPGERSRLWCVEEARDIFESHTGTENVVALCLDVSREQVKDPPRCLVRNDFGKLQNLRYLKVYADFAGDFEHLLSNLRWLHCWGCTGNFSLTNFHLKNLVVLHLLDSSITDCWEGWSQIKMAMKLKVLDISFCKRLRSATQFYGFKNLERLIMKGCEALEKIDPSNGNLRKLKVLDLSHCRDLRSAKCCMFTNLESLDLRMCQNLRGLYGIEELKSLKSLKYLNTFGCRILKQLPDLSNLKKLIKLNMFGCRELIELEGLDGLESLELLDIRICSSIERLPDLSKLGMLKELYLPGCKKSCEVEGLAVLENLEILDVYGCTSLERKPDLSNFKKLKKLNIGGFNDFTEIEGLGELRLLEMLKLRDCMSIKKVPDLSNLKNLREIDVSNCVKLTEIVGLEGLKSLEFFNIKGCESIEKLSDLSGLINLKELKAAVCEKMTEIVGLEGLKSLELLNIKGCDSIEKLPDFSGLINLKILKVSVCVKLSEIWGLEELKSLIFLSVACCVKLTEIRGLEELNFLKSLIIDGCESIEKLPDLSGVNNLEEISTSGCVKLNEIKGLEELNCLKALSIDGCESIEKLPDLSNLENLEILNVSGCVKLTEIPGLEELKSLEQLNIEGCKSIENLPDLSNLKNLRTLDVSGCVELTEIPGLEELNSLEQLDIQGCNSIEELPDFSGFTNLKEIRASGCVKLTEILGLERLYSLERVDIEGCESLKNLPWWPNIITRSLYNSKNQLRYY